MQNRHTVEAGVKASEPNYAVALRGMISGATCNVHGCAERWAAPVALIDCPSGFGEETWANPLPDSLLAWRLGGAPVVSEMTGDRGKRAAGRERKVNLQPRGAEAQYRAPETVRFGHFYISDALLAKVCEGLELPDFTTVSLRPDLIMFDDAELWRRLDHYARRTSDVREPPSRVEMEALALLVIERLLTSHHTARLPTPTKGGLAPWQLKRTCEAMTAQLDANMGLDDLAEIAGCSPTHFSRAFKHSMGLSPFHWLDERRIERAKELLEENRLSLAEIALAVGFSAQPQFTTAFGRATGMPPGQRRRERLS